MSAIETWGEMVRVEHAQSDRMRGTRPADTWRQHASRFRADPNRTDDSQVEAIRSHLRPDDTLLDVGAGGGRLALPLALSCRRVTAVEPSPSMGSVLLETARDYGIENITLVESAWLDASVEPADVVLCCNVVYVIQDIGAFVRKLHQHARRTVLMIVFQTSPLAQVRGLWEQVHGETRHLLPSLPQFLPVLDELGISCETTELESQQLRVYQSPSEAREDIATRLFVAEGTEAMERLDRALESSLQERDGQWHVAGTQPARPFLVSWDTSGA